MLDPLGVLEIWNASDESQTPIRFESPHVEDETLHLPVDQISWSPDSRQLIAGSKQYTYIYDAQTGRILDSLNDEAIGFAWYKGQKLVVVDGHFHTFDTTVYPIKNINHVSMSSQYYRRVLWKSENEIVLMSGLVIEVWDTTTETILSVVSINPPPQDPMRDYFTDIALDSGGEKIVVIYDRNHISIYDLP
jgi:WD40 repeat protein